MQLLLAYTDVRSGGGGSCCSLLFVILFTYIYRSGGTDWGRSIGTAIIPGIFGWFIWRDRELGGGARWTAVIMASLQAFFFVLGIVVAIAAPAMLRRLNTAAAAPSAIPTDVSNLPEDPALGLHPPATISSDPSGATVTVNGQARGKTPLTTPLNAGERNDVKVELLGYFPATQSLSPNAREQLNLSYTLKTAALLKVSTEPPGARVLVAQKEVLAKTPGLSAPIEPGPTEVVVLLPGHQPHVQAMELTGGENPLEVTLQPGTKITVRSTPDQAEVFVDGQPLGLTPLDVFVAPKGKHTVEVKKEPYATAKKIFASVTKPAVFAPTLVDTERVRATQAVAKARARYDKANAALEKIQVQIDSMMNVPAKLEQQRKKLDAEMERASGALEQAEGALRAIEDSRPAPAAPKEDPAE